MQTIATIGLDIAKSVFQVHGVDAAGEVIIRRQLKRRSVLAFFQKLAPCLVGIEACASSHHWSRELQALGHTVRLMPPAHVKPGRRAAARGRCRYGRRPASGCRPCLSGGAWRSASRDEGTDPGHRPWLTGLLARRPTKVAAIALANKLARMAWAMMARVSDSKNRSHSRPER